MWYTGSSCHQYLIILVTDQCPTIQTHTKKKQISHPACTQNRKRQWSMTNVYNKWISQPPLDKKNQDKPSLSYSGDVSFKKRNWWWYLGDVFPFQLSNSNKWSTNIKVESAAYCGEKDSLYIYDWCHVIKNVEQTKVWLMISTVDNLHLTQAVCQINRS